MCWFCKSCIGYQTYMRLYTKVMLAEAAISLISFVIGDLLSLPLPLLHYEVSSVNGFYLTPYFTLGWLNIPVFHRNAGMFNEPGSHQIFLNFALLFLMSDETRMGMSKKKYRWAIALLIVTILSTLSTTGFICLGVVLLTVAFRKKGRKMARSIKMAAFIGLILLFVIESATGVVEKKIIGRNSGGSFYTRWNDTISGFEIGLESPIAGQGVFSERKAEILLEHRVQNISNGFAAFVMDTGLILPAVWLWLTYRGIRTKFAKARLLYVLGVFPAVFPVHQHGGRFPEHTVSGTAGQVAAGGRGAGADRQNRRRGIMNTASRSENTARNIGVGAVRQVLTLLLAFAVRTVFVRRLGADYTGVNGLYSNILAMLSLAELGVGNVLVYSLYAPLHRGDTGEIQHLLGYYRRIYRLIALAVALLGAAVIPFLPLIISSELPMAQLIVYYVLYLANSVASYLVIYKTTLIQADQKAYLQNMVSAAALVVQYASQMACLLIWGSYLGYLLIQIACTLLQNAVLSHLADKMYPFLRKKQKCAPMHRKQELNDNIRSMFLYKLATILINNTDNILISIMLGTVFVGYYSNYASLTTYVTTFVSIVITGISASLGNLNAEKNSEKSYAMFRNLIVLFGAITGFCVAAYGAVVQDFIPIWVGEEYLMDTGTVAAVLFTFYLSTIVAPVWMYRETLGLFRQMKYVMFMTALVNILLSILLGHFFGVAGIIGATGLARLCTIFWYEPKVLFHRTFGRSAAAYFKAQGGLLLLNGAVMLLSLLLCARMGHTLMWIIIKGITCAAVTALLYTLALGRTAEYRWMLEKGRSFLRKWRKKA